MSPCCGWCQRTSASAPDHLARAEVDERHVDEPHLAALERLAEIAAVLEVLRGNQPHRRVEDPDLALAGALGLVHRDVGIAQQAGRAHARRRDGDADAGEHGDVVAGDRHRVAEAVEQSLGDVDRAVDAAAVLEQDRELVAAEAGGGVAGAGGAADAIGDGLQQLVADGVAERVVDRLEVVEVDEQHDDRVGLGTGDAQGVVHAIEEQRPVGEPGELVVEGTVAELAFEVALLGDVAERGDDPVDRGATDEVGDDDRRLAELAVGVDERRLELDRAAVAELDQPFELADRALTLVLGDDVEQMAADPALGVVAERRPQARAGVADAPGLVGEHDDVARVLDHRRQPIVAALLGQHADLVDESPHACQREHDHADRGGGHDNERGCRVETGGEHQDQAAERYQRREQQSEDLRPVNS